MRKLLLAAAMVSFTVACHNRNEDEVGAAPDQGTTDTAATTHVIDSTRTGPPGVGGRPGNATVTADSVGVDSAAVSGGATDTTAVTAPASTPQDTLAPGDAGMTDSTMQHDGTMMQHDSTMMHGDSTMTDSSTVR